MTSRFVVEGIRDYLEAKEPAELSGVSYAVQDETEVKEYPLITVASTGTVEHEVLVGVYVIGVAIMLETNPETVSDEEAAPMTDAFYNLCGDTESMKDGLDGVDSLRCWYVRQTEQSTTPEDGRRRVSLGMEVTAAAQV